jgi:hypothetical protein
MLARTHTQTQIFGGVLGFELRAYTLSYSASPFLFEIGSFKLFAQAVFQP